MSANEVGTPALPRAPLELGTALEPAAYATSTVLVFRYSAATWNTHRIHYDKAYALAEGYPDVLVQSHLHGAFLARYCSDWAGEDGRLMELGLRVRRFAIAGETLIVAGVVSALDRLGDDRAAVTLELTETRASDLETAVTGTARIDVPIAWLGDTGREQYA